MARAGTGGDPPAAFEEFRLVRPLGRGAMGQVHLAHDTFLNRPVAVKFIAAPRHDEARRRRFIVEARAIARLQHPNVVSAYRVGEVAGYLYLVSEYVRGTSLDKVARPAPPERLARIALDLARGLAAAHRRGVLHRDIKPANAVLSDDGEAKLLDFGLAKLVVSDGEAADGVEPVPDGFGAPDAAGAAAHDEPAGRDEAPDPGGGTLSGTVSVSAPPPPPGARDGEAGADDGDLTAAGALVGTPLYIAPEIWAGEVATRRSDVYSLGILLYELATGEAPRRRVPLAALRRAVQEEDVAPLHAVAPGVDPRLAAIVDRCVRRDPAARFEAGDALREAIEALAYAPRAARAAASAGEPYRGLRAFEAEHRHSFHGRAAEIREVLDRLRAEAFVLVAGDSGAGKSSLCRAGVIPLVEDGALEEAGRSRVVRLSPGRRPLAALAASLAPVSGEDEASLLALFESDPAAVARRVRRAQGAAGRTLLFVDHMEELLTLADPREARVAAEVLSHFGAGAAGLRLLATARGDFLTRLSALPGIGADLGRALYILNPIADDGLREAIVAPARARGFTFETDALVDALAAAGARAEGGLPLLQFTLAELWARRDPARHVIPAAALDAMGGVAGALARHADGVIARLSPAARVAAREILSQLVTAEGTRARRTGPELSAGRDPAATRDVLTALVDGRLLVARRDGEADEGTFEVAHEALLTGWDTLRGWLAGDAELRAVRQRLERAAAEWARLGRAEELLFAERQLVEAGAIDRGTLGAREREFLAASTRAGRRRRARRLGSLGAMLLLPALAAGAAGLSARRDRDLRIAAAIGEARQLVAEARGKSAEAEGARARAFERFDARDATAGEELWARAAAGAAEADRLYARAGRAAEDALAHDGRRAETRALLAETLYERVLLAERDHRAAARDELRDRLGAYDDGTGRRLLDAPAELAVETSPAAAITLERAVDHDDPGARDAPRPAAPGPLRGTTPIDGAILPPGSYVLALSAAGRTPVRLPIRLDRGERRRVRLDLPAAAAVPDGFVYVPAGRFQFGSADPDDLRRSFLGAPPLHAVETPAYLIARHEVTFADWIAWLRALPPPARAARLPRSAHLGSLLELHERPGGDFELTFRPSQVTYTARSGEPIRYLDRDRRATADWLRFPVSAISFEDAIAYAAWLDASGRVPGARLCDEREWERAARGADDRRYAIGDRLAPDDANIDVTYNRGRGFGPDEAGAHPASRSPYGLDDTVGNVAELVRSFADPRAPVSKGGSFYQGRMTALAANHQYADPGLRNPLTGVRLCATPAGSASAGTPDAGGQAIRSERR